MSFENIGDRLSTLPDEIVSHILSLMPMKFAVRTSVLSKRWKCTWKFVKNLYFRHTAHENADSLPKFVDRVLGFCKTRQIKLFRLHFPEVFVQNYRVSYWIDKAVRLRVHELDIRVNRLGLPLSMYTCKTLKILRLHERYRDIWDFSCSVNLPCLKTLDVLVFSDPLNNVFKLICGCPVLESLSLAVAYHRREEDYIFNIPTLKRMELTRYKLSHYSNQVVLNVPNLEYLYVKGTFCSVIVIEDVSSLKSLELHGFWHSGLLAQFLKNCPMLKHLCIGKLEECCWIEPKFVPTCMLKNLTTITFSRFKEEKCEIEIIKYILGHAKALKKVTILWEKLCKKEKCDIEFINNILVRNFSRASKDCVIHTSLNLNSY